MGYDDVDSLLQLYRVQIKYGCGDKQCNKPFCLSNEKRKGHAIGGRIFTAMAAQSLANHLVAYQGESGVCAELKRKPIFNIQSSKEFKSDTLPERQKGQKSPSAKSVNSLASQIQSISEVVKPHEQIKELCPHICLDTPGYLLNKLYKHNHRAQPSQYEPAQNCTLSCEKLEEAGFRLVYILGAFYAKMDKGYLCKSHLDESSKPELLQSLLYKFGDLSDSQGIERLWSAFYDTSQDALESILFPRCSHSNQAFLSESQHNAYIDSSRHSSLPLRLPPYAALFRRNPYFFQKSALQGSKSLRCVTKYAISSKKGLELFRYACLRQMEIAITKSHYIRACFDHFSLLGGLIDTRRINDLCAGEGEDFVVDVDRGYNFLASLTKRLSVALRVPELVKRPLRIRFGAGEQLAVDQGGLQVEVFQLFGYELTHSSHRLFLSPHDLAWFNPGFSDSPSVYQFVGMWFGIALYNGCMVDIRFPLKFYSFLQGLDDLERMDFDDFAAFDPVGARSLQKLLKLPDSVLHGMDLAFEFSYLSDKTGTVCSVPLPSAKLHSRITHDNVELYVDEYIQCAMICLVKPFIDAFKQGFRFVIGEDLVHLVESHDLQLMIEGTGEIDTLMLEQFTSYDGYTKDSLTIRLFWEVVKDFSQAQKESLLEFVTGSKRIPFGGMAKIDLVIQHNGNDTSRLPSSAVCFSRLLLPEFSNKDDLRKMLLLALEHSKGFGLI